MTPLAGIVTDTSSPIPVPSDWTQGRTAYGGLTAALSVAAARRAVDDLPPLVSAHFAFTAPVVETIGLTVEVLRRGRSVTSVAVRGTSGDQVAAQSTLVFAQGRLSAVAHDLITPPSVPAPDDCPEMTGSPDERPAFAQHFDMRVAGGSAPVSSATEPHYLVWVRHRDAQDTDPLIALVALGDALPPAATAAFSAWAPVSSVTWDVHLCVDEVPDASGWFLISSRGDHARDGYAHQTMHIFDEDLRPVMAATQTVAVFA
ncbi:thioesterase family protein [Williamsia deligens]|uniref:Thioesterase family protein n=1 Tax=Williamsia deligens TaxID=321325 RepID=A0ABW3G5X2_9NOCA|nr:thioesterase family protein [Williamsia deligens]